MSPPPGARWRSVGSIPSLTSRSALITVLRLMPDASATALLPPRPRRLGHGTGHHTALQLVQMGQDHLEESRELISAGLHQATLHRAY